MAWKLNPFTSQPDYYEVGGGVPSVETTWRTGSGTPNNGTGINGDFYLDTATGDVYLRSGGTYSVVGTMDSHAAPSVETTWRTGSGTPNNAVGIDGDFYLDTATDDIYLRSGGTYSVVGSISGGAPSVETTWRTGSGTPNNAVGIDGDFYVDTDTGEVYVRSGGTYSVIGNLSGFTAGTTSYGNPGGHGLRTGAIGVTTTVPFTGTILCLVRGDSHTVASIHTGNFTSAADPAGQNITFDFAIPVVIDEMIFRQVGSYAQATWKWQGSNDGVSYTDIGSNFSILAGLEFLIVTALSNTTAYRFYRMLGVSGTTSNSAGLGGMWFRIAPVAAGIASYFHRRGVGDRTDLITVTTDMTGAGSFTRLVRNENADFNFTGSHIGKYIKFDFGIAVTLTETTFRCHYGGSLTGEWKWQACNDDASYADVGSSFTLSGNPYVNTSLSANVTAYRYWKLVGVSGSPPTTAYMQGMLFKMEED